MTKLTWKEVNFDWDDRFERGDSQGVSLLSICRASRWHEDVPRSSSPVLLDRDEETRRGLCATISHMSVG